MTIQSSTLTIHSLDFNKHVYVCLLFDMDKEHDHSLYRGFQTREYKKYVDTFSNMYVYIVSTNKEFFMKNSSSFYFYKYLEQNLYSRD